MHTIDHVSAALTLISEHADKWPTEAEIRANARGIAAATGRSTPPPDQLPFGFDRTMDTPARTRTRAGATLVLCEVLDMWLLALNKTRPDSTELAEGYRRGYDIAATHLINLLPQAYQDLPEDTWEITAQRLVQLAEDTRTQCATGHAGTPITCPNCPDKTLTRPYTPAGISDVFTCQACAGEWTQDDLHTLALAHSAYVRSVLVTRAQAAALLGLTWEGIQARVKRRALAPVEGKGHGAKYVLRDLQ